MRQMGLDGVRWYAADEIGWGEMAWGGMGVESYMKQDLVTEAA